MTALLATGLLRGLRCAISSRISVSSRSLSAAPFDATNLISSSAAAAGVGQVIGVLVAVVAGLSAVRHAVAAGRRGAIGAAGVRRDVRVVRAGVALLTAVVCVLASIFIANGSRFVSGRTTGLAARLTAVGYAVPGPVVAMGVVLSLVALDDVLEGIGLGLPGTVATGSLVGLVYAYSIRFLAPGLNAIEAGMAQVPEEITASARSLGARPATIVRRIHTPLARTSVATGAVLVAVDALKELPIALLLRPIGFNTLPIWTFNLATESRFEQAALPALAIIVVAMIPVALLSRQLSRGAERA